MARQPGFRAPPVLDLHPFVDNQCCAAATHLQHAVQIPNFAMRSVVGFPN
jgi:hypothetical protein